MRGKREGLYFLKSLLLSLVLFALSHVLLAVVKSPSLCTIPYHLKRTIATDILSK